MKGIRRMIERYILVSDDEYCYTLDTFSKDYKTLEDYEKEEMEIAKKEGVDIVEYEEEILLVAHDRYWEWVYEYHMEADEVNDMLNNLSEENEQLKQQLLCDSDSVCDICKHEYLIPTDNYFIVKCRKGHEECSKEDIKYCEDFEFKGLEEKVKE